MNLFYEIINIKKLINIYNYIYNKYMVKKYCIVTRDEINLFPSNYQEILGTKKFRSSLDNSKVVLSFSIKTPDFLKDKKIYMSGSIKNQFSTSQWIKPNSNNSIIFKNKDINPYNTIYIPNHNLVTGQCVQLLTPNSISEIGLSCWSNYFIIKIDENNIKLADSYQNAINTSNLSIIHSNIDNINYLIMIDNLKHLSVNSSTILSDNTMVINNHTYYDKQIVQYLSTNPIGGLLNNSYYYIKQIDNNNLKLENLDNSETDFTTLPLTQDLHCLKSWLNNKTFKSTNIIASLDTIKISNHSLYTGYQVELINILNNNLNISINQKYFIIKYDDNNIRLALSSNKAFNNEYVNIDILNNVTSEYAILFN